MTTFAHVRDRFFPGTPAPYGENLRQGVTYDKLVVHIGARAGSTRIRNKNIRELCGIPLMAYTILVARGMGADRVILDTDSEEYARIGQRFGAEVPFLRPEELARDTVSPGLSTYYTIRKLLEEGYPVGYCADMYPTSPFRNAATMRTYAQRLRECGTCVSVNRIPAPPAQVYARDRANEPVSLDRAQDQIFFKPVGAFVGFAVDERKRVWRHHEILRDPVELIDIDTEGDWQLAEQVLEANGFDFGMELPCC